MKNKPSEWIAIADLMSGVMAVVMLLLVLAVLQQGASELRHQEELTAAKGRPGRIDPLAQVMQGLSQTIRQRGDMELMALDTRTSRLTLRDSVFERGSACLTAEAQAAVEAVRAQVAGFMVNNHKARIVVEGYTDNIPVRQPVTDYRRFCTVYDDNFTLSAARAREARRALIGTAFGENVAKRIVVAGYGDSRPLEGLGAGDARNRRVEVQFSLDD